MSREWSPKQYEPKPDCEKCKGTGKVEDKDCDCFEKIHMNISAMQNNLRDYKNPGWWHGVVTDPQRYRK